MSLGLVPLSLAEANAFVARHHRHHRRVVGHMFSLGAVQAGDVCGVAIVGPSTAAAWATDLAKIDAALADQTLAAEIEAELGRQGGGDG